ncbi:hypothetical protein AWZ03_000939 [Drosophila navojoa]|uniref:Uncharacterized protein n=1 Tax=Drosophila navojoa TaxID=7232 RepID=A0A484BV61_DRONA|nr:hypothetical protein AWZ03_000939 [Drosophila navojoa]
MMHKGSYSYNYSNGNGNSSSNSSNSSSSSSSMSNYIRERLQRISLLRLHFNLHRSNAEQRNYNQFGHSQDYDLRQYTPRVLGYKGR